MKEKLNMELFCIYNDPEILNEFLLQSIEKQSAQCKVTLYDGSAISKTECAASIYNRLITKSKAEVIICMHHDVSFESKSVLQDIYDYVSSHPQCIVGAAGVEQKQNKLVVWGNVLEGDHQEYSRLASTNLPQKVLCLDECLFAFHKQVFQFVQFDEDTCNGWHFYAADLCYSAKIYGIESFVLPINIWHKSTGKIGNDFYVQLGRIQKKYRKRMKRFITPCIDYNTKIPPLYYKIKRNIWIKRRK